MPLSGFSAGSENDFGMVFGARGFIFEDFWHHLSILGRSLGSLGGSLGSQGRPKSDFRDFLLNCPLIPPRLGPHFGVFFDVFFDCFVNVFMVVSNSVTFNSGNVL